MGGTIVALLVLLFIASLFVDEPMRRSMERRVNQSLKGYQAHIGGLHFQLIGLSVTLKDVTVRQQQHPDPPVMTIPRLHASVHWREILSGKVVADFMLDRPELYVNLPQLRAEARDETPMKDKGWQQALEQIYPLKINQWRIYDGKVTYIDEDPKRPLTLTHLMMRASNIRNIHSTDHTYPSPLHVEAVVLGTGHGVIDGHANFLADPFPGIHTVVKLEKVPLDYFRPIVERANLSVKNGELGLDGEIEYAPGFQLVHLTDLTIRGVTLDYVHTAATAGAESARKQKVAQAAKASTDRSDRVMKLDRLRLVSSEVGLVNKAKSPGYRVFVSGLDLEVTNLSNHFVEGPAKATARGLFMGKGNATASATFRPEGKGPDFDLKVAIDDTPMTTMNDLLRSYGKFDVVAGIFSFYSELSVHNDHIDGYVKPLFRDMQVYDKRQDAEKSFFRKTYEKLVGGISKLLENPPRNEVATKADISGPVSNPNSSTLQVIGRLVQNAFFRAILPGFDEQLAAGQRAAGKTSK
ncbi:MAG TPA: DUF748 domain-containing protein [Thermoanaerobaculia bacterium]|nr:DUF748 domain-containing protein [Thermoanaerobaculia bacterium]